MPGWHIDQLHACYPRRCCRDSTVPPTPTHPTGCRIVCHAGMTWRARACCVRRAVRVSHLSWHSATAAVMVSTHSLATSRLGAVSLYSASDQLQGGPFLGRATAYTTSKYFCATERNAEVSCRGVPWVRCVSKAAHAATDGVLWW